MRVFISDLHLGDGSRTDDFSRDEHFLEFLEFVKTEANELIILGDFLELWQADLDRVVFRHSQVINKLLSLRDKVKITYVIGNHDYLPFIKFANSSLGIATEYRDSKSGIVAEHGHRYDAFNRYKNPLKSIKFPPGKYFTKVVASLERLVHPDVDVWVRRALGGLDEFLQEAIAVRNKVTPTTEEYIKRGGHFIEFEKAVASHIKEGARIVIFGHTHKAQLQNFNKRIYANCGTWVDGDLPTYIAHQGKSIELREGLTHKVIKKIRLN